MKEERPIYECVKPSDGKWANRYRHAKVTPPIPDSDLVRFAISYHAREVAIEQGKNAAAFATLASAKCAPLSFDPADDPAIMTAGLGGNRTYPHAQTSAKCTDEESAEDKKYVDNRLDYIYDGKGPTRPILPTGREHITQTQARCKEVHPEESLLKHITAQRSRKCIETLVPDGGGPEKSGNWIEADGGGDVFLEDLPRDG